jgi:hypothetical protein
MIIIQRAVSIGVSLNPCSDQADNKKSAQNPDNPKFQVKLGGGIGPYPPFGLRTNNQEGEIVGTGGELPLR